MALHKMASVTVGVPRLEETAAYYADFGLAPSGGGWFASADAGDQLRLLHSPVRRLVGFTVGVDDPDDLARVAARLTRIGVSHKRAGDELVSADPVTGTVVRLHVEARLREPGVPATPYNGPGRLERRNTRAPGLVSEGRVRPHRLGHVALGTTDFDASMAYFVDGIGFKISDLVKATGAFTRCTTDHHNLLLLRAPVNYLHHTSWQVADVDEVGRGAMAMLAGHPERHIWGLGRHHVGSNFFWYLKDPAGNFSEYYSDTDCIIDDQLWKPGTFEGDLGLYNWGPPPPPSFIRPDDLAELMLGLHR